MWLEVMELEGMELEGMELEGMELEGMYLHEAASLRRPMQGGLAPPLRSPAASGGSCLRSRERSNNGSLGYEAALRSLRGSRGTG